MRALPIEKPADQTKPAIARKAFSKSSRQVTIKNASVSGLTKRLQKYAQAGRNNYSDADVVSLIEAARGAILAIHYQRKKQTRHKSPNNKKFPPKYRYN